MTAAPWVDATPSRPWVGSDGAVSDVRFAAFLVGLLVVVGAALGPLWAWWSPPRMAAVVYPNGSLVPDTASYAGTRQESWIAGDGRFLLISAVVGLLVALLAWLLRPANRGAVVAAALAVGGVGGALLMDLTGHLTGGGDVTGRQVQLTEGTCLSCTLQLPLWVHSVGVLAVEAGLASLLYLLLTAFAARDDLGHPDPVRELVRPSVPSPGPASVHPGADAQHGGGHGDAPGAAQQGEFPPGERRDVP